MGGVFVITLSGGFILWHMGILQPILSQCIMYVYITVIMVGFVSLLLSQTWRVLRKGGTYVIKEFQKLRSVFRFFGGKTRYKFRDFLDDGKLSSSYDDPKNRG